MLELYQWWTLSGRNADTAMFGPVEQRYHCSLSSGVRQGSVLNLHVNTACQCAALVAFNGLKPSKDGQRWTSSPQVLAVGKHTTFGTERAMGTELGTYVTIETL